MEIREAKESDWPAIWTIFQEVVQTGDTYAFAPDTTEPEACKLWFTPPLQTFVAVEEGTVLGTYVFKPNQPGLGAHIANAGFMVASVGRGHGLGRAMGLHALATARQQGFRGMQFNFVVSTNERAIALWQSLGFSIVGTVPHAFHHRHQGFVDIHILYRSLLDD